MVIKRSGNPFALRVGLGNDVDGLMIRLLKRLWIPFGSSPPPPAWRGARRQSNTKIGFYAAEAGRRSPVCLI
jgi:hypothetical protein